MSPLLRGRALLSGVQKLLAMQVVQGVMHLLDCPLTDFSIPNCAGGCFALLNQKKPGLWDD